MSTMNVKLICNVCIVPANDARGTMDVCLPGVMHESHRYTHSGTHTYLALIECKEEALDGMG